jgi:transcriptional regulator with XRE-family HTH domain
MSGQIQNDQANLGTKVAHLVEERGWNQEDFARIAGLNRQTVRQILQHHGERRLRNVTISRCAKALGLSVNELRNTPLDRLLLRMHTSSPVTPDDTLRRLYEQATQPELQAWLERNPERARQLTAEQIDELLSLQGTGGPLTKFGVEHFVDLLGRKQKLVEQIHAIAGTEYLETLEKMVGLMYDKIRPYSDRAETTPRHSATIGQGIHPSQPAGR